MSYGYGDWNSGASRGYEGYGYGYGYGAENSAGYGYGAATDAWEPGKPEADGATEAGEGHGKQRPQPGEPGAAPGPARAYGAASDRYEPYEPYGDSRSALNDRDLYRAGFDYPGDYPDYPNDYPNDYPDNYPDYHDSFPDGSSAYPDSYANESEPDGGDFYGRPPQQQQFPGKFRSWGRDRPFPSSGGRGGWSEGRAPPGARRLPSLFAHNILPEAPAPFRAFPGAFRGLKRFRRGCRAWDGDFRPQRKRLRRDSLGRRRKQPGEEKAPKTDGSDNSSSENEEGTEGESGEKEESRGEGEDEEGRDSEKGPPEELSQPRQKLQPGRKSQERQKKRHRDRMVERIQFVCSLCKFRTFFEDEIQQHLESKFHREHFQFVGTKLPQQTAEFLQEYVANKTRKTEERRRGIRDISGVIQQIQREQDLTQDVPLEHFVRKVEAAHCSACDLLLPMHLGSIQKHLKCADHNHNRRAMMEQSKKSSLVVARSILNNKLISKKLEKYLKGENPFTDDPEEKEEHEEGEGAGEENPENPGNPEENPQNPEENPEENPKNPEENPKNPEENPKNPKNPEENPKNPEENPKNPEENPEENPKNPEENPKNPEENPEENPKNPEENPKIPEENPKIPEENPKILEENPKIPEENPKILEENPEENAEENKIPEEKKILEEKKQIPEEIAAAEKQERGTGTNPEKPNSPNPEKFPREEEENSGMFQE